MHYSRVALKLVLTTQLAACSGGVVIYNQRDGCTLENEAEMCAAGETCVNGVCTTAANGECSAGEPFGVCPGAQACVGGECQEIVGGNACSSSNPSGLCPGGEVCIDGDCYPASAVVCSPNNPNGVCPEGERCDAGTCVAEAADPCSPAVPDGTCPGTQECIGGACEDPATPVCSAAEPNGTCPTGNVCIAGTCIPIDASNQCTSSRPTGLCPDGQICDAGTCVPIDPDEACSPANPTGLCDGGAVCDNGVCTAPPCSPTSPYGACPRDEICVGGTCEPLPCGALHPTGFCPITETCVDGTCECDVACGSGCGNPGEVCDTDTLSPTCGECICDVTCASACGAGEVCDSSPASATCGQCVCDRTCGDSCVANEEVCDTDTLSPTCGQCLCDVSCGNACSAQQTCDSDPASATCGQCSCDTTCGGGCGSYQVCDSDLASPTCGDCICDTACAGACVLGEACDTDPASATCGQCVCDTTCAGLGCNANGSTCDSDPASATCGECICASGEFCSVADWCCASGEVCVSDRFCRPPCASGEYCGAIAQICCDTGEVCGPDLTCIIDCPAGQDACGADWDVCCGTDQACIYQSCLDLGATCTDFLDCDFGEYCEPTLLRCLPTDIGGGEDCSFSPPPNIFNPEIEWHWLGAQADGSDCTAYDSSCYRNVIVAPMVADLDRVDEPELTWTSPTSGATTTFPAGRYPEVVFKAYPGSSLDSHALVILDGRTGETKSVSSGASYHGNVMVANLDGDAKLEVVHATGSGIVALDPFFAGGAETDASWSQNAGNLNHNFSGAAPAVTDLNDDGLAEVFLGGVVVDGATGDVLADFGAANQGGGPVDFSSEHWYASAVADVDLDGRPEILLGNKAVEVSDTCDWVEPACDTNEHCEDDSCVTNAGTLTWSWKVDWDASAVIGAGFPGVGNFVDNMLPPYSEIDDPPEVVVTIDGEVAFLNGRDGSLMTALDGSTPLFFELFDWRGGAPNIADFDGDGRVEMSFAGRGCMVVVDVDCAVADAATRAAMPPGCTVDPATISVCTENLHGNAEMADMIGLLWMDATQDASSAATGTSVFDFQGDGIAEVLYNDECFLRVYNGEDGSLYMERPNSSRTGSEYPIVVDVDGDRSSEIVLVANNDQASPARDNCAGDPSSGAAYWSDQDLYQTAAFCDEATDPSARPDDRYDICRVGTWGVWSLGDVTDLWVKTLPYWHQHTYHVTEVTRDGQPVADWGAGNNNWDVYNNYRQNVQGYVPLNAPNPTVASLVDDLRNCPPTVSLRARIANMGSAGFEPAVDGDLPVSFYKDVGSGWEHIDTVWITTAIPPGQGLTLTLDYVLEDGEDLVDFAAVVNDDGAGTIDVVAECQPGDNVQYVLDVTCDLG